MSNDTASEVVLDLIYTALVDIKELSVQSENKLAFNLADLFLGVPEQLKQVERGEVSHRDVLNTIRSKANAHGAEDWLDKNLKQLGDDRER